MTALTNDSPREGWHFLRSDRCLAYPPHTRVVVGETLYLPPEETPRVCVVGYHASKWALDALYYAPHSPELWVCRVVVGGPIDATEDKFCGAWRRALWIAPARETIARWAIWCAKGTLLGRVLTGLPVDARLWDALDTAERYLAGQATWSALHQAQVAADDTNVTYVTDAVVTALAATDAGSAIAALAFRTVEYAVAAATDITPAANVQARSFMAVELEQRLWALAPTAD